MPRQPRQPQRTTLADQLRAAIASAGLSDYRLAQETGVAAGSIGRFLRRERDWSLETAELVARRLGLELVRSRFVAQAPPATTRSTRRPTLPRATSATAIAAAELPAGDELPPAG